MTPSQDALLSKQAETIRELQARLHESETSIKALVEALGKIEMAGFTTHVNEIPYPLRVTAQDLRDMAREALAKAKEGV